MGVAVWYRSDGSWRLMKVIESAVYVETLWRLFINWETRAGYVRGKAKNLIARESP